uniref:Putative secreted protein n=1 Tax=Ixodes ricinus TaxID=34613 RepID=A0A6B0UDJ1_IXORI
MTASTLSPCSALATAWSTASCCLVHESLDSTKMLASASSLAKWSTQPTHHLCCRNRDTIELPSAPLPPYTSTRPAADAMLSPLLLLLLLADAD